MEDLDRGALVRAAQNGDEGARQKLYAETVRGVYFLALKMLQNPHDAEDMTQEVFATAFEKLGELQEPKAFGKWINLIAANKCKNALRKKGEVLLDEPGPFFEEPEQDKTLLPDSALDDRQTRDMIAAIIDALPLAQKLCVYYYYYESLTVAQIAELLECSEGTVKSRLSAARAKIRQEVDRIEQEQGIKLYNLTPLLAAVLHRLAADVTLPQAAVDRIWADVLVAQGGGMAGPAATAAAGTGPQQAVAAAAGKTGFAALSAAAKTTIIALAVAVVLGIAVLVVRQNDGIPVVEMNVDSTIGSAAEEPEAAPEIVSQAASSAAPEAVASEPVAQEAPESEAETEPFEPTLSDDFFVALTEYYVYLGFAPNKQAMERRFENIDENWSVMWNMIFLEEAAARGGHTTPANLLAYAGDSYGSYDIPADVLQQAIWDWYEIEYDVTGLNLVDDWGLEFAVYHPETDTVRVEIDGIGWSGNTFAYNPRIQSVENDGTITALVDYGAYETDGEEYITTGTVVVREHANGAVTLLDLDLDFGFFEW